MAHRVTVRSRFLQNPKNPCRAAYSKLRPALPHALPPFRAIDPCALPLAIPGAVSVAPHPGAVRATRNATLNPATETKLSMPLIVSLPLIPLEFRSSTTTSYSVAAVTGPYPAGHLVE